MGTNLNGKRKSKAHEGKLGEIGSKMQRKNAFCSNFMGVSVILRVKNYQNCFMTSSERFQSLPRSINFKLAAKIRVV